MAKLTISGAARVAGVARSTLHRAIHAGRLSPDPDGHLDTAELLRAGYTLQAHATPLQDATPRTTVAQHTATPAEIQAILAVQQERDLLRQQLATAQAHEHAALEREREARDERQAAREREAYLLRLVEQMQHRYDRLLEAPRTSLPPQAAQDGPGATQTREPPEGGRGTAPTHATATASHAGAGYSWRDAPTYRGPAPGASGGPEYRRDA